MVLAYWQIGKMIVEKQGGEERAKYGDGLIKELSIQMTKDFGRGFDMSNLLRMRRFYVLFKNCASVRQELSWTHYKLIISLDDENTRKFYMKEAIEGNWSTRQLEREIHTFSYQRYIASNGKTTKYLQIHIVISKIECISKMERSACRIIINRSYLGKIAPIWSFFLFISKRNVYNSL